MGDQMKVKGIITLLIYFLLFSSVSHATIISGESYTEGGKSVALQGLECLSIDTTAGYSRTDIENGYGGLIDDGWRYANRLETATLLNSLWGGTYSGGHRSNGDGADWFFRHLGHGPLWNGMTELRSFFYGSEDECSSDQSLSCRGFYGVAYSNVGYPPTGWFYLEYGLDATMINPGTVNTDLNDRNYGSLLVRGDATPVPVSEPGTIGLLGAGLLGLKFTRRRRAG